MKAAAARRLQRAQLDGDLGTLLADLEADADDRHPVEVLLDAVHRTWAMVQVLGALTGGLSTDGPAGGADGMWGPNHLGDGAPHVLTTMYGTWLERAARASKLALDAGIDERRVRLAERLGALIAATVRAVLDDIDLTPVQRDAAAVALPRHLRALAGGLDEGIPA